MSFKLSKRSTDRLIGVHPDLVRVVERAIEITKIDFMVVEGLRSRDRCAELYGKGRTAAQCSAKSVDTKWANPGVSKVTWLNNPYNSKHCKKSDGYGHAVDLLPEPYDWKDVDHFVTMSKAMIAAAAELGVKMRWGGNWDMDGQIRERGENDLPHFELY